MRRGISVIDRIVFQGFYLDICRRCRYFGGLCRKRTRDTNVIVYCKADRCPNKEI
jgi:hypothetical protein